MNKRTPKNLCLSCKHAEWFRSRDGLCHANVVVPVLPHGLYWVTQPYIGKVVLHRDSKLPQECSHYEWAPETKGKV